MEFSKCKKLWKFSQEAFEGDGGFEDGSYIDMYPRESDDKYQARQKIAYYTNLFAPKVNRYIGYLFKQKPTRITKNNLLKQIIDDVDNKGNNINVFMSNFAKNGKIRGVNLLLIDMPKQLPANLKEQIDNRLLPYFVEIAPERVTSYKLDKFGKFEFIKFTDTIDNSTPDNTEVENIERYYDKNEWRIYKDDEIIESGSHNLGICPVIYFSESGEFESIGEFTQVAGLMKRHYNLQSELDEILRGQTFSILTVQADTPNEVELNISTDNAIFYQRENDRPDFIAPSANPANSYEKKIDKIENQISAITYDLSTNQGQESGISLDIKFQGLNGSLSNFSMRLEDLEMRAFDVVCRYLSINYDIVINYPKTFSIIDVEKEINILSEMKNLVDSPTYSKLKTLQIISNDLNSIEPDEFDKIVAEVEDSKKEVEG